MQWMLGFAVLNPTYIRAVCVSTARRSMGVVPADLVRNYSSSSKL